MRRRSTPAAAPSATVAALVRALECGGTTVESVVRSCLERIDADEPRVRAWAHLDPELAIGRARELDRVPPGQRAALHGIPLGVKDIFDTHDMPTAYGSPIYDGHRPAADSASVAMARTAGMLPLGKLATTEFAAWRPGPTANPHDPSRTPGGSSSGSAAAVAAGMVPVAFATQTTGSIVRPAAFCGVVGVKPSHGLLPTAGVKAISESFDTVGVIARTVADAAFVLDGLSGRALALLHDAPSTLRLGVCLTHEWPAAQPETERLFADVPRLLESAGARITPVELPDVFGDLAETQHVIWTFEIARCLADEHRRHRDAISERLLGMLDAGVALSISEYDAALAHLRACRAALPGVLDGLDALVVPAAPGEAPPIESTGDPVFNRIWSALGGPAVAVPSGRGPSGLPLGVQIVGMPGRDAHTLACAAWVEAALGGSGAPAS